MMVQQACSWLTKVHIFFILVCSLFDTTCTVPISCQAFHSVGTTIITVGDNYKRRLHHKIRHHSRGSSSSSSSSSSSRRSSRALPLRSRTLKMTKESEDESGIITTTMKNNNNYDYDFDFDRWQAGGMNSFSQTCFAEYWYNLPSIVVSDTDSDGDNEHDDNNDNMDDNKDSAAMVVVNPYDFRHRMALNKYLIEHTTANTGKSSSSSSSSSSSNDMKLKLCSHHPIWGYAAQLDWQHRSGRLEDPSKWKDNNEFQDDKSSNNNNISKWSWWGHTNLNFSVASYCGAAEAGLVPSITLSNQTLLDDNIGFQTCVGLWKDYWESGYGTFLAAASSSPSTISKEEEKQLTMTMYRALWTTHTGIIKTSLRYGKDLENMLPEEDRGVGLGWCNMVELLAATNWPLLSLDNLYKFGGGYLPSVRLAGPKTVQWLKTHRKMEYTTVQSLYQLRDTPPTTMHYFCCFFGRVSRWKFAVNNLPRTLHTLTHGNPVQKVLSLSRVVGLALFPRSFSETIGVVVATAVFATTSIITAMGMGVVKTKMKFLFG